MDIGIWGIIDKDNKTINYEQFCGAKKNGHQLFNSYIYIDYKSSGKFSDDCVYDINADSCIIFDGVLLNKRSLFSRYHCNCMKSLIETMYQKNGKLFFDEFRGSFCGVYYDTKEKCTIIFNDHLSNKPLFYYQDNNYFIFASKVQYITDYLKQFKKIHLNIKGAYCLLSYAYMYSDFTLFEEVKRLTPGNYLLIQNNQVQIKKFYEIGKTQFIQISDREAVNRIDALFCSAVKQQAEKNMEYHYSNYAPLSAGLDSRMTVYTLKRLGFDNVINFTYSQTGEFDHQIPGKISGELGYRWIFKNLNNGLDLYNIDEAVNLADTLIYFAWPAQLNDMMSLLNTANMGIVHTGVLGDVIIGTYANHTKHKDYQIGDGAYSHRLIQKVTAMSDQSERSLYPNYEIGMLYNRAMNGACLGYTTTFSQYTEALSPFMDVDLFDFCMSLPFAQRYQHKLYYNWVKTYYPAAAKHTHNGIKISNTKLQIPIKGKRIGIDTISSRFRVYFKSRVSKSYGMNPFQYWYNTNQKLRIIFDTYFNCHIDLLSQYNELYKDAKDLYLTGNATEKILCLSLIGSLKSFM